MKLLLIILLMGDVIAAESFRSPIRKICERSAVESKKKLAGDIRSFTDRFVSIQARRKRPDEYFDSMKNIISQTSQGKSVVRCFENNPDERIGGHQVTFIGEGPRRPGNDEAAYLDFRIDKSDPLKRVILHMVVDLRTHPVAALSMVAHEMKHACLGSTISDHINECTDTDSSECAQYNEAIFADELVAHHFEARIFAEFAESSPEIMCAYKFLDGDNGPQLLSVFHAQNEEAYQKGELLRLLNDRYTKAGLWQKDDIYDRSSNSRGPKPGLRKRLKRLGIPPQK